jgi:SPP1 gp7 family putative phage head morphogenesis protein
MRKLVDAAVEDMRRSLMPDLMRLLREAEGEVLPEPEGDPGTAAVAKLERMSGVRVDASGETITRRVFSLVRRVSLEWAKTWVAERLGGELGVIFRLVDGTVRQSLGETFKSLLGINPLMRDVGLAAREEVFRATNVALIQSIASQFFGEVEGIVGRGLVSGTRPETMGEQIAGRFGVSQTRGRLIARDQIAKVHGQLDSARQQDLGITRYRWLSAQDERVRPDAKAQARGADPEDEATSHRARDGKVYEWANPPGDPDDPSVGGHPGFGSINCRCVAQPIIEDVLQQLGI